MRNLGWRPPVRISADVISLSGTPDQLRPAIHDCQTEPSATAREKCVVGVQGRNQVLTKPLGTGVSGRAGNFCPAMSRRSLWLPNPLRSLNFSDAAWLGMVMRHEL